MPPKRSLTAKSVAPPRAQAGLVAEILLGYATRGVFRGFGAGPAKRGTTTFQVVWHRDRTFQIIWDPKKSELRFPEVLTGVPAASTMYRDLRGFIESACPASFRTIAASIRSAAEIRLSNRGDAWRWPWCRGIMTMNTPFAS